MLCVTQCGTGRRARPCGAATGCSECARRAAERSYARPVLTVERVSLLRSVALFAQTPDRVLAGVASALEEVGFAAGEDLMRVGAVEDWLFVVVEGDVEVVRPDRRLTLGPGSVVGELAVLDPEPRSATVTARGPVVAFRLTRDAFDEAVRSRPEVAIGVITELVRRLRAPHDPPAP